MPTVTGERRATHQALQFVAAFLQRRGMHVAWHEFDGYESLVATTRPTKTPEVFLYAHIDVIPAPRAQFTLTKKAGAYHGRGVYDMKVALAAYLQLVDDVQANLARHNFGIILTSDEELGGKDGINGFEKLLAAGYRAKMYVMPDGAHDWQLETSSKGYLHYTLSAAGKAAHGSRPWEGNNALHKIMDTLHDLRAQFAAQGPATDTLNIGAVHGGERPNRVPASASAEIELRVARRGGRARLERLVRQACRAHGVRCEARAYIAPIRRSLRNPYLKKFARAIEEETGIAVAGAASLGGSDARFLAPLGIPAAVFYPRGGGHHSDNEWLQAEDLAAMHAVIKRFILHLANARG